MRFSSNLKMFSESFKLIEDTRIKLKFIDNARHIILAIVTLWCSVQSPLGKWLMIPTMKNVIRGPSIITFTLREKRDPSKCEQMEAGGRVCHINVKVCI